MSRPRIPNRLILILLLSCQPGLQSCFAQETIPTTPAGRCLTQLIDAINSDDANARLTFWRDGFSVNDEDTVSQREMRTNQVSSRLGKLKFKQVIRSSEKKIAATFETTTGPIVVFAISVSEAPHKIETIALEIARERQSGEDDAINSLDAESRSALLKQLAIVLRSQYVLPELGEKMAVSIETSSTAGRYNDVNDLGLFAARLTAQLREISQDRQIFLQPGAPRDNEPRLEQQDFDNYGFEKVEMLRGGIGYLKVNYFSQDKKAEHVASAAMNFLAGSKAVIFDVRGNGGGDSKLIAYLSSYLFEEPVHLNDFFNLESESTKEFWTSKQVPGAKLPAETPVYVLTSKDTFSEAEEFAYNLQNLHRAIVVGETTSGSAHQSRLVKLGEQMHIWLPFGRAINPLTKTNWQSVGVKPDFEVSADQALEQAVALARGKPFKLPAITKTEATANEPAQPGKSETRDLTEEVDETGTIDPDLRALIDRAEALFEQESFQEAAIVFAEMTSKYPDNPAAWFRYGTSLHLAGELDRAIEIHRKAAEFEEFAAMANYNLACGYALKGKTDNAFAALQKAVDLGFADVAQLIGDSDLDKLRNEDRFRAILKQINSDQ